MSQSRIRFALVSVLTLAVVAPTFGQADPAAAKEQTDKLIAVLKSDAPQLEKMEACRQLGVVGTKDAVAPLAAMLGDEKLSHMIRYAMEPIPDPAVDDAFRDALGKLKGRPLVGVIGSIGVRRDEKAIEALAGLLKDPDADVSQAAARALGRIGTSAAAKALTGTVAGFLAANQLAFCEGLFRCAEALAVGGRRDEAIAIYDKLLALPRAGHQVRAGALRGAILARQKDGLKLLQEHLVGKDYVLFAAACRTALEMAGAEVTQILTAALKQMPPDNKVVAIQTLGWRKDAGAVMALTGQAKTGEKAVRLAAIHALAEIGDPGAAPVLTELAKDTDSDISKAAQESLSSLSGAKAKPAEK
jgi:HEAT repeat protein